jgi:hypothetical protein
LAPPFLLLALKAVLSSGTTLHLDLFVPVFSSWSGSACRRCLVLGMEDPGTPPRPNHPGQGHLPLQSPLLRQIQCPRCALPLEFVCDGNRGGSPTVTAFPEPSPSPTCLPIAKRVRASFRFRFGPSLPSFSRPTPARSAVAMPGGRAGPGLEPIDSGIENFNSALG